MSDSRSLIQQVLHPGEKIVWTGEPQAWRLALPVLAPALFFFLCIAAPLASVLGSAGGVTMDDVSVALPAPAYLIFPAIIVVIWGATFSVLGRQVLAAWRTHYVLTNQRAIILVDVWPRSVQSYGPADFFQMTRNGGDDIGTIVFGDLAAGRWRWRWPEGLWGGGIAAFSDIPEPRRVEALIRENLLKNNAAESAPP